MIEAKLDKWSERAYQVVQLLVEVIGPRGSTTSREEEAAAYVQRELEKGDIPCDVHYFQSPKSAWQPFIYIFLPAALTTLIAPLALPYTAVAAAVLLLLLLWIGLWEINLKDSILLRLFRKGSSQNVIGRITPKGEPQQTIVLVAHLDSHRTPYFHQSRERQHLFNWIVKIAAAGIILNCIIFLLAAILGQSGLIWFTLPAAVVFLWMVFICRQADRTPFSPGANDNAAAVGVVLAMAEELTAHPLANTDVWVLFSGCEEVGCYGMRNFLDTYGPALGPAKFINFEMVGHGFPGILLQEGVLKKQEYDPQLIKEARIAATTVWGDKPFFKNGTAYGESVVTQAAGFPSVTLNTLLADSKKTAFWHRPDDDFRVIEKETIGRVVYWGLEILDRIDKN